MSSFITNIVFDHLLTTVTNEDAILQMNWKDSTINSWRLSVDDEKKVRRRVGGGTHTLSNAESNSLLTKKAFAELAKSFVLVLICITTI